jgi:hypothetical protein
MIKKIKALLRIRRIKKIRETPEIYRYIKVTERGSLYIDIETEDFLKLEKVRVTIQQIMNSSFYKNTFKKTPHL